MKLFFTYAFFVLLFACKYQARQESSPMPIDSVIVNKDTASVVLEDMEDSSENDEDSVTITFSDLKDTLIYTQAQYNNILKYYPELTEMYVESPDEEYAQTGTDRAIVKNKDPEYLTFFSGESGIDEYYMLYAYLLKKRDGIKKYKGQRKTLIEIFRNINSIHSRLEHGGTGFGHMLCRIEGYAEYAVYQYDHYSSDYQKNYPITKQKKLFMAALRQFITDQAELYDDYPNAYKEERKNGLFRLINNLDSLITNYFYLSMAREFEYKNYK